MIYFIFLIVILGILYLVHQFDVNIDITQDQIILWYTPLNGGRRTFKILYEKTYE